ncbi:hypothetical protein CFC21_087722, partial [Triticum aestivum]
DLVDESKLKLRL